MYTPDTFNQVGAAALPGHLGMVITHVAIGEVHGELVVGPHLMAPNGFLQDPGAVPVYPDAAGGQGRSLRVET